MSSINLRKQTGQVQGRRQNHEPYMSPLEQMRYLLEELEDHVPLPCSYMDVNHTRIEALRSDGYTSEEARIMERLEAYENALLQETKDAHLTSLQPHLEHINDAILKREDGQLAGRAAA